jgi:predicted transcriptional regulator
MKKKTTSIQMDNELRKQVEQEAEKQKRSVSNMITVILREWFNARNK